ncbi:hypothetical protein C7B62_22415 [Pleurocapsa sp. CCALA 161]|uniref:hypothetical protein n=1 Tax=Pleurocapsa sp. CCALA 161 TaxID=2107688 RepID=UPI000D05202D|nr:hypothetical protein [Pleurocapsa sp. CCALA 161]PSB06596.1 hypothetical protein C7B62_22415 [Pleurocapsa sp. CCALA 161]
MNNNYRHPAMENEGLQPYVSTLEAEQELHAYELENSRPAVEELPTLSQPDPNLSPDFAEFSNSQETQIQQELYKLQERSVSSIHTRLCDLKDKLNSRQITLKSQLRQVEEQLREVHKQLREVSITTVEG